MKNVCQSAWAGHGPEPCPLCRFSAFEEQAGGKLGKRRSRWHSYLAWLRNNPDLAAWRGGPPDINELPADAKERIKRTRPSMRISFEAREFWRANPELEALDGLHGYYEKEFVRRRKTKRNPDGFDHRPTFTLPDLARHPQHIVFSGPQTSAPGYRKLKLPGKPDECGSLDLRLLVGESRGGQYPDAWINVHFRADPRLADLNPQWS